MEPVIGADAYFVANPGAFHLNTPERWDLVAFDLKGVSEASALWVAALPGEKITLAKGRILVDGKELQFSDEIRWNGNTEIELPESTEVTYPYQVPEGAYFLLGTNLDVANDSRAFGAVDKARFVGLVNR